MAIKKRQTKAKRSLGALPKGLIRKSNTTTNNGKGGKMTQDPGNPFEVPAARRRRPKHEVHNRPVSKPQTTKFALESLQRRQTQLRSSLKSSKKANSIVDRRIGQYDPTMTKEDQMLARLVKERSRQSQRSSKYRLEDEDGDGDNGDLLTHKGQRLDPNQSEAMYSDDEDANDNGALEAVDTELHFGGAGMSSFPNNPYGASGANANLAQVYGEQRKTELEDLIARRKHRKAERMKVKENQLQTVETLDEGFAEISELLEYRKDENKKKPRQAPKKPTKEEEEMNDWNRDIRAMMSKPKRKATDRTKPPEEVAKEEAETLHELETRRLARMNGDFEEDDFSDISVDDYKRKKPQHSKSKKKRKKSNRERNPEELSDSDDNSDDDDQPKARFTPDGLKYFDKDGNVVEQEKDGDESDSDSESGDDEENHVIHPLAEGQRVQGNYRSAEQFGGHETWHEGAITKVHTQPDGSVKYDVEYDDRDFEEDMIQENVRPMEKTAEEKAKVEKTAEQDLELKFKRNKARDKAR
jgi:nucleolar protein 14